MNAWMWNNDDRLCQHTTAMIQLVCVGLSCELHCRAYCMHNFYAKDPPIYPRHLAHPRMITIIT